jgi:hypothetical protein
MSWRTTALVFLNALFVTIVGLRLWKGTETDRILQVSAHQVKVPVLHLELPPLYADFIGLADRAPFYASRRLYVPPAKPEDPPPPVPKYLFGGAVIRPHGPGVALLNNPANGSAVRVIAGNNLEGWRVESIDASRVVLRYEDQRAEIAAATKRAGQSVAAEGVSRAPVTRSDRVPRGGGVRVLGNGQTVSRGTLAVPNLPPAASNLPPLAGSGSGSVYIPPPPR